MLTMIKNKLSILLADRLITKKAVSLATGLSRTTLTEIYFRRNRGITMDTLDKLCRYLQCSVGEIFEFIDDPAPVPADEPGE